MRKNESNSSNFVETFDIKSFIFLKIFLADGKKKMKKYLSDVRNHLPDSVKIPLQRLNELQSFVNFVRTVVPIEAIQRAKAVMDEL
jgi:hypothetical protein